MTVFPLRKLVLLADVTTTLVLNILFVSTTMAIISMRSKGEEFRFRCVNQVRVGVHQQNNETAKVARYLWIGEKAVMCLKGKRR